MRAPTHAGKRPLSPPGINVQAGRGVRGFWDDRGQWYGVSLSTPRVGPEPTGPGVPGQPGAERSFVDSTKLAITLLIVLMVVIDRAMRR